MQETTTRVPALVDALNARLVAAFNGSGVQLDDGPPLDMDNLAPDVLSVGFPGPEGTAVDNDMERQQGLGNRYKETFEVHCVFSTTAGSGTMKARRDRCLWALGIINAALKQDTGLGGVVDRAGLGSTMRWGQDRHPDGVTCDVMFSIVGEVLL
jgi:hypothetical protein